MHLGGEEIPHTDLSILADQAEVEALRLYSLATHEGSSTIALPSNPPFLIAKEQSSPTPSDNVGPIPPPTKPKASLKPSKERKIKHHLAKQDSPTRTRTRTRTKTILACIPN
jgi:hypothetical protein